MLKERNHWCAELGEIAEKDTGQGHIDGSSRFFQILIQNGSY